MMWHIRPRQRERTGGYKPATEGTMSIRGTSGISRSLAYLALVLLPVLVAACGKGGSSY
jgi:hypothetical protein